MHPFASLAREPSGSQPALSSNLHPFYNLILHFFLFQAFDTGPWPRMPAAQRAKILHRLADLIEANGEELALLETLDQGKTITQSRSADIPQTVSHFRYFAGMCDKIEGSTIPSELEFTAYTLREPIGVVGQIIPW